MKRKATSCLLLLVALLPLSAGPAKLTEDQKISQLLNRMGFGPRPGDVEKVRAMGIDKYIDLQLNPERIPDPSMDERLSAFPSIRMDNAAINKKYVAPMALARQLGLINPAKAQADPDTNPQDNPKVRQEVQSYMRDKGILAPQRLLQELQGQKLVRAVYSERQLQEVMTDFWYNHFNIFWAKGADKQLTTDFEMNAIRPHTLGKFKDLVMATAKSPAMLFYLDNWESSSADAKTPATLRLEQLKQRQERLRQREMQPRLPVVNNRGRIVTPARPADPTATITEEEQNSRRMAQIQQQLAQQSKRTPGINENYARELMELHTMGVDGGYTQKDVQEVARAFTGWTIDRPRQSASFTFREAMHDKGDKTVLGHTIKEGGVKDGEEVIDILVHHPSTAHFIATKLVRRFVADDPPKALVDRVAAVYMKSDGDIREMLRTIFTSDEFYSPEAYRSKTKSPFELAVSAIRALGGDTNGSPQLIQTIAKMGQPLYQYQPPTGFPDRASQWTSSGALVERLNFGVALSANRLAGTRVNLETAPEGSKPDEAVDRALSVLLRGDFSEQTRKILLDRIRTTTEPPAVKAFAMVLGAPEFQKR